MKKKLIDISEIKPSGIRYEVLPEGFIDRVIKFKVILREVETSSIEETISNFQRDLNPERELAIWESIACCYKLSCENNPRWTLPEKKRAFAELLSGTMC
ncbi:hypothetical protein AUJ77_02840 [Candidatus Nomurabacteria bacterium CG1_02_43_90]|uniref:Uncharacterized protein n=1 Tax=Candidatus Nomurabacteria bacterium CG1_02_43_90 TaxID=1805281 RepID=A0A1J4V833_9BACT|nr:MAG: hypothetical protein AUJ77_02840 [Candidatus Nomurabacteria bacterium CG1_02_43_90]PIR56649.1 MAG: hypothetical protein COU72_05125 [Parcubacteria group bacterium CG10_big_fil_rev_8_21_14_0_10_41_35]